MGESKKTFRSIILVDYELRTMPVRVRPRTISSRISYMLPGAVLLILTFD